MKITRLFKNLVYSLIEKKTVGARALVIQNGKVLLVQHTYMDGWYTIGGAVDKGEPPKQAVIRELQEEVGIKAKNIQLFNVYFSRAENRDDYIVFYICTDFIEHDKICEDEIKSKQWFDFENLPSGVSPATLRRIKEYLGETEVSEKW